MFATRHQETQGIIDKMWCWHSIVQELNWVLLSTPVYGLEDGVLVCSKVPSGPGGTTKGLCFNNLRFWIARPNFNRGAFCRFSDHVAIAARVRRGGMTMLRWRI